MKYKFPIAKMRADGTPAIWLTCDTWRIISDGIIRKYLEVRESDGRVRARREARTQNPQTWQSNVKLKSWAWLDNTQPLCGIRPNEVLELYRAGISAHPSDLNLPEHKLVKIGDSQEQNGYLAEKAELEGVGSEEAA